MSSDLHTYSMASEHMHACSHAHTFINKAFKGMTSPTSHFICLLDQNSWHVSDPPPPSSFCPPSSWRAQPARGFPLLPCHGRTECLIGFRHYVFCWKPAQSWCDKWILPAAREWRSLSHPPAHKSPIPQSCSAQPWEQGTEICPEAPSASVGIYAGPLR